MRMLTEKEYATASRFLFLSMAIVVMRQDIKHVTNGPFKIKDPYLQLLQTMESRALEERRELRKVMKRERIDVVILNKNDSFSSFLFLCRGKEEKRNFFNPRIRKIVQSIIHEYVFKIELSEKKGEILAND